MFGGPGSGVAATAAAKSARAGSGGSTVVVSVALLSAPAPPGSGSLPITAPVLVTSRSPSECTVDRHGCLIADGKRPRLHCARPAALSHGSEW